MHLSHFLGALFEEISPLKMAIHLVLDPPLNEMRLVIFLKSDLWVDKRSVPNYNKSEIKLGTELYKKEMRNAL